MRRDTKEDHVLSQSTQAAPAATARPAMTGAATTSDRVLEAVLASLDDDKAEDIVQIPLRGKTSLADHMVIASGRSSRQVSAIAEHLIDKIKQDFGYTSKVEGKETSDWVLIDTGDVIVHIFRPEVREFYQLEKMWLSPSDAAER